VPKPEFFETAVKKESALLIGVSNFLTPPTKIREYLDELSELTDTAGADVADTIIFKQDKPIAGTFIGSGKLEMLRLRVVETGVNMVVFDEDLSPSQVRNIDRILGVKVLDRSGLILHIFSERARSAQARAQVELAQLQYLLPRLTGLWQHLGRERGGIGLKGAGEKEIETDRRIIREKITKLKEELKHIDRQSITRRKQRDTMVRVALVGYTNVGKSTLMNILSKSDVLAENRLFATLDATVRKVVLEDTPFLLSDTVGFIRKLPHTLIECFKSTLDEVRETDLLIHVSDISNPAVEEHNKVVLTTLKEIGAGEKPLLHVLNKSDLLDPESLDERLEQLKLMNGDGLPVSAFTGNNIAELRILLIKKVREIYRNKYPNLNYTLGFYETNEL
jgi:GTP-binding protein HflX